MQEAARHIQGTNALKENVNGREMIPKKAKNN